MIHKLLCGALSAVLLGQASVVLADGLKEPAPCGSDQSESCMHSSELVKFPGYRTVKADINYFDTAGNPMGIYSVISCVENFALYFQEGSVKPGLMQVKLSIETPGGWFETINMYDVVFSGKGKKAYQANPQYVRLDMSSYDDYPACEPIAFEQKN